MTITANSTSFVPTSTVTPALWRHAAGAGLVAAAATTAVAAIAHAAGASLAVGGEPIPPAGFAMPTLICVVLGYGLAVAMRRWAGRPRRAFVRATITLTALSLVPDLLVSASADTRATLMTSHFVAAAIVIPVISARLPRRHS